MNYFVSLRVFLVLWFGSFRAFRRYLSIDFQAVSYFL